MLPEEPSVTHQELTAKNGHPIGYNSYSADLGDRAYMVSYSDYDTHTAINLDGAADGVVSANATTIVWIRREIEMFKRPGRYVEFDKDGYRWKVRLFAVGKRLYQVSCIAKGRDDDAERFLDSFRYLGD